MAQNQREINRLRHIIEEKDREIEMLRENEDGSGRVDTGITEGVTHRVNELEGMVKGLTEELLDLKAEVRKLGKVLEGKEELKPRPDTRRARPASEKTVKRSLQSSQPESRPEEPEIGTATIMQPDGTLAEEPRKNDDDLIVAGNRPAKIYPSKANREYRGKEEKKPLIYADEDDTIEIKKK